MDATAAPLPLSPAKYSDSFMLQSVAPRYVYCKHQATVKCSKMLRMKTTDEIRYENLQRLVDDAGDLSRLVEKSGGKLNRPTLDQILKRRTTAAGVIKNVGNDLARSIEEALRLERGWMDNDHTPEAAQPEEVISPAELAELVMAFCQTDEMGRKGIRVAIAEAKSRTPATSDQGELRPVLHFRSKA